MDFSGWRKRKGGNKGDKDKSEMVLLAIRDSVEGRSPGPDFFVVVGARDCAC
jgi:hypothetical protein